MTDPATIRARTVAVLEAAGLAVRDSDPTPWEESEQPGVRVFVARGSGTNESLAQPRWRWTTDVVLDILAVGTDPATVAADRDTMVSAALAALLGDGEWMGLWETLERVEESDAHAADGRLYRAQGIVTITGSYPRQWLQPAEDDLSRIHAEWDKVEDDTGEPDGVVDVEVDV